MWVLKKESVREMAVFQAGVKLWLAPEYKNRVMSFFLLFKLFAKSFDHQ